MDILAALGTFFGNLFKSFFCKSDQERLGAAEEQATVARATVQSLEAQAQAAANAPKDKESLIRLLLKGKAALFYLSLAFLPSCAENAPRPCLALRDWTPEEQRQQADEIAAKHLECTKLSDVLDLQDFYKLVKLGISTENLYECPTSAPNIDKDGPLMGALLEWAEMRLESKACQQTGG